MQTAAWGRQARTHLVQRLEVQFVAAASSFVTAVVAFAPPIDRPSCEQVLVLGKSRSFPMRPRRSVALFIALATLGCGGRIDLADDSLASSPDARGDASGLPDASTFPPPSLDASTVPPPDATSTLDSATTPDALASDASPLPDAATPIDCPQRGNGTTILACNRLVPSDSLDTNGDYTRSAEAESVYLQDGAGQTYARALYVPGDGTGAFPGGVRQYLEFGDHLGSTGLVDDFDTGDIVERSTYLAYGGPDVDYRNSTPAQFGGPPKYGEFRETYRYTGHDDDSEVGLSYAGARYYMPMLSRWASPDPLTIHGLGSQLNPYAYAANSPYRYRDPFGLQEQQPSDNSEGQQDDPGGDQPSQAGGQPSGQGGNGGQGGGGPYGSGYGPVDYGPRSSGGGYDFGPKVYANYQWSGAASAPSGDASGPHGALDEIQRAYSLRNLSSTFRNINWWRVVDPNGAGQATIQNAKDAADPSLPIDIRVGSGILAVAATIIPEVSETGLLTAAEGLSGGAGAAPRILYHYTNAAESSFARGLWSGSSVTDSAGLGAAQAVETLGLKTLPDKIIPIIDRGYFVPNRPFIVQPHPLGAGGGTDFFNMRLVPAEDILPAIPVGGGG